MHKGVVDNYFSMIEPGAGVLLMQATTGAYDLSGSCRSTHARERGEVRQERLGQRTTGNQQNYDENLAGYDTVRLRIYAAV